MNLKIALLAATAGVLPCYVFAQTTGEPGPGAAPVGQLQDVVVTARKRSEKLLNVPISITVLSGKDLQKRQVHSIQDLANQTPGFSVDSTVTSSGRNDRSFPEFVVRGMVPSVVTNPTTTIFLDGAPLVGGEIDDLENLEQVEVLKGPQNAYFGRQSFAGAVSLTTRDPSQAPTVTLDTLVGDRNYTDDRGTIEGALIPDKISVLGSFRYYSRDGSYTNQAAQYVTYPGGEQGSDAKTSQKLGDQETKGGNLEVVITPTENLKIKLLGDYFRDNDGPSAQALIGPGQSNCEAAPTAESGAADTAAGGAGSGVVPWFCGQVPDRLGGQPAANDVDTPGVQKFFAFLNSKAAGLSFKPLKDDYGLAKESYHGSATVSYYMPSSGLTLTSLTALDLQKFSELQDFFNVDGSAEAPGFLAADDYNSDPFFVESQYRDLSQELRVSSDSDQPFRYTAGFNYEYTRVDANIAGSSFGGFTTKDSPDSSFTVAGFAGIEYDITHDLTLSADGRFESAKESTSPAGGFSTVSATYKNFLPRISLQYKITPTVMVYGTYSEGINPGVFNGYLPSLPAAEQTLIENEYGAKIKVKPEKLDNYEAGVKGSFMNDTLQLSADAYYDIWYDQIIANNVSYVGAFGVQNTASYTNGGKTDLPGVEGDADWLPIPELEINAAGAINDSKVDHGSCFSCIEESGTANVKGKKLPDVSEFQATIGAQWTDKMAFLAGSPLDALATWDYYGRGDYTFKSSQYENYDNMVYTPAENLLNLRAGITHGNITVEAFVDNVTNWGGATSLSPYANYSNPFDLGNGFPASNESNDALLAGLPDLRTFGVRLHYKFGL